MPARIVLTEIGGNITATHLILGPRPRKADVHRRAQEVMRRMIRKVMKDHPHPQEMDPKTIETALARGSWWTDLGSEEFSVLILSPQRTVDLSAGFRERGFRGEGRSRHAKTSK